MIAYLRGILQTKNTEQIVIDVHGMGFLVFITLPTFYTLPETGQEVDLYIHTSIRENNWQLFGFKTTKEREIFELLLTVTKIGPKLARNLLSHISTHDFETAIVNSDINRIKAIPGIGEKTARRLVLELKDKIASVSGQGVQAAVGEDNQKNQKGFLTSQEMKQDAVSALVSLGYKPLAGERIINQILQKHALEPISLAELIKKALLQLAQG